MLELDHLTVSGDVTFGKNVSLKVSVQWRCCCNKPDWSRLLGNWSWGSACTQRSTPGSWVTAPKMAEAMAGQWPLWWSAGCCCQSWCSMQAQAERRFIYEPWKHHRCHISVQTLLPPLSFGSVPTPFPGWPYPPFSGPFASLWGSRFISKCWSWASLFFSNSSLGSCQSWQHLEFSRAVWQLPGVEGGAASPGTGLGCGLWAVPLSSHLLFSWNRSLPGTLRVGETFFPKQKRHFSSKQKRQEPLEQPCLQLSYQFCL